ncbi:peptide ABC transporter substrate-binding protein [Desulfosarcina widdelii]|uniref:Peptide ABC transporter substrate-binding protein n=1 Tax=Desulfosarcina widdelii TaxID=947919 RepID=A0A5K7Z8L4_9BACT|nr:ABC transporter substrate-binding protein [Desulfosarcina widdelii]BBO74804.1 peptide ABC transporter substrate-binding protein [Desulfosarcina widdelii]
MKKKIQLHTMSVWMLFLIGVLCASISLAAGPRKGGTLRFGTENDFAGFEVLQSSSRLAINGSIAANTIMEPLFRMDNEEHLIPVLGLSAAQSEDGKTWTINLRKNVKFHDGTVFNADAVVHHWNRLLNPENKFRGRAAMGPIVSVTKLDEYTIQYNLKHPWLPFKRVIGSTRGLVQLIPSSKSVESGNQNRAPVGTGPFRLKEWKSGDAFTVVKNPDYWEKDVPFLDEIVFKPMTDSQTRYASLQSGQVDIIWMDRGNLINKAKADNSLRVYTSEDNGAEIFILNTSVPPLDDVNVRRALAHAHNQERQVEMVYKGSIPVVHHPFGSQCACSSDGYRAYNPDRARKLLAGYGQPVELEVLHSSSKRGRDTGEITQRLFKDVGVTANPAGFDFGPVIKKVLSGQYQVSTWRISSRPDQGPALFLSLHSKSRANFSRYKNPEMDKLLVAQRLETDPDRRNEILCKIARLINDDVPFLYRGGMRSHVIASKNLEGLSSMKNGIVRLESVWLNKEESGKY